MIPIERPASSGKILSLFLSSTCKTGIWTIRLAAALLRSGWCQEIGLAHLITSPCLEPSRDNCLLDAVFTSDRE